MLREAPMLPALFRLRVGFCLMKDDPPFLRFIPEGRFILEGRFISEACFISEARFIPEARFISEGRAIPSPCY